MINKIRNEVEQATMQDLSSRRRQRELVYARAIYFKLCKEKTTSTLKRIAGTLGVNHATVLHAINNVFPLIKRDEPYLYEIYSRIKNSDDLKYIKENYNALRKEHESLINKYEKLIQLKTVDEHEEIVDIVRQIPNEHIDVAKVRVKAMVDMIKTYA
jgi:adenylate kinase family enzyme|tara:strand:+ start:415 stop:885 length:471 start_codon:yes stop_codon:yes gene_type:complete